VQTKLARFTRKVVPLTQKTVVGNPDPAVQKGNGGYADWVILSIHSLRKYLDHPYRILLDVLHEMPNICTILGLEVSELPDFSTACARMQTLKMPVWRRYLELSAKLHETGEIQAIDATGMDRIAASHHYAKRTNYTFKAVKTTALTVAHGRLSHGRLSSHPPAGHSRVPTYQGPPATVNIPHLKAKRNECFPCQI
jgi:hypothetical protein